jgi:mycothiol synthase
MTTLTRFETRHYLDDDVQAVCDLLNACDAVDKLDDNYTADDLAIEFNHPELSKEHDLRLWHDAAGTLVGFGQLWIREDAEGMLEGSLYMRVHPGAREQGIEEEILAWAETRTRSAAQERNLPARLRSGSKDYDTTRLDLLAAYGYTLVRYFFKMARPLDQPIPAPQFPEGFTLTHTADEAGMARWIEAFNLSFIDHWNHHPATVEGHVHWLSSPKYRPEGDLVALAPDGTTVAAFCLCWIDPEENARNARTEGWIDVLGTRRGYRQIGLGRAMLVAGMHYLKAQGVDTAVLGVDAENPTGALRLYESVGFGKQSTWVTYRKDL